MSLLVETPSIEAIYVDLGPKRIGSCEQMLYIKNIYKPVIVVVLNLECVIVTTIQ
jgi:hypothetical protein